MQYFLINALLKSEENMDEKESVYEEWRTYPPVPDTEISDNSKKPIGDISTSEIKNENR